MSENKFLCDVKDTYNKICKVDENGTHISLEECISDCTDKYLQFHLSYDKVKDEVSTWISFINTLSSKYNVYLRGGTVIGLYVLKLLSVNNVQLSSYFDDFYKLNLIKDWDFTVYTNISSKKEDGPIPEEILNIMPTQFRSEGKTIGIIRNRNSAKTINDEYLYEMSVKSTEPIYTLEIPMTALKVKLDKDNVREMFACANQFYNYSINKISNPLDFDFIKYFVTNINIIEYKAKDGLFNVDEVNFVDLSNPIINIIKNTTNDLNEQQFLVCQTIEPDRLFFRLLYKNIPKSNAIKQFLDNLNINQPKFILNEKRLKDLINKFIGNIDNYIDNTFNDILNKSLKKLLDLDYYYRYGYCSLNEDKIIKLKDIMASKLESVTDDNKKKFYTSINDQVNELINMCNKLKDKKKMEVSDFSTIKKKINKQKEDLNRNFKKFIDKLNVLFSGVNIGRLVGSYSQLSNNAKQLLYNILSSNASNIFLTLYLAKKQSGNVYQLLNNIKESHYNDTKKQHLFNPSLDKFIKNPCSI